MKGNQITVLGLFAGFTLTLAIVFNYRPLVHVAAPTQAQQISSSSQYFDINQSIEIRDSRVAPNGNNSIPQNVREPAAPKAPPASPVATSQVSRETVSIELSDPDGMQRFEVKLNPGDDLCANLVEAKAEGKIKSLLVDSSYLESFHSLYIREINGYSNNWTVEVLPAGRQATVVRPEGCSLYKPKMGDDIIWRFGA